MRSLRRFGPVRKLCIEELEHFFDAYGFTEDKHMVKMPRLTVVPEDYLSQQKRVIIEKEIEERQHLAHEVLQTTRNVLSQENSGEIVQDLEDELERLIVGKITRYRKMGVARSQPVLCLNSGSSYGTSESSGEINLQKYREKENDQNYLNKIFDAFKYALSLLNLAPSESNRRDKRKSKKLRFEKSVTAKVMKSSLMLISLVLVLRISSKCGIPEKIKKVFALLMKEKILS